MSFEIVGDASDGIRLALPQVPPAVSIEVDGGSVSVTVSIGVAIYPRDATDLISLQRLADQAAYLAKRMGKNRICYFDLDLEPTPKVFPE